MDRPVGSQSKGFAQRLLGLRRPLRKHHDLVGYLCRVLDGIAVVRVQLERDAFALERVRLLVELDRPERGNLLDEADRLHSCEPIEPCWGSCTTFTGTCPRSIGSSRRRTASRSTAGCSGATTQPRAPGPRRRSSGWLRSRTKRGSGATASAGSASPQSIGPR